MSRDGAAAIAVDPRSGAGLRPLVGDGLPAPCIDGHDRPYLGLDAAASTSALPAVARAVEELPPWYSSVHRGAGYKEPMGIVAWLVQPLLFLFVLGPGLQTLSEASTDGVDLVTFMFPGTLCMALVYSAIFSAASLVWDRELGFVRELTVAPVRRWSIVLGKTLGGATIAASQGVVVLALAGLVGVPYAPALLLGLFGLIVLVAFTITAFGVLVAVSCRVRCTRCRACRRGRAC